MRIHKEGKRAVHIVAIITVILFITCFFISDRLTPLIRVIFILSFLFTLMLRYFYRYPNRNCKLDEKLIYIPADGKIVVCEKVEEKDYFKSERLQVSVFMSVTDVHVNWVPASGEIVWIEHTDGVNYPAHNPKASGLNEKCKTVIRLANGEELMVNQIAGIMARRVVNNKKVGDIIQQGDELGIIKFGSRVDIFLPLNADIQVKIGQKVKAKSTILAKL